MKNNKFSKNSIEWRMFGDIYQLVERYWMPEDSDEYWQAVVDSVDKISDKYNNTSAQLFVNIILSAFVEYLQTKMKEGTNED
jgi:hypothetical protein